MVARAPRTARSPGHRRSASRSTQIADLPGSLDTLAQILPLLAEAIGPDCEVILHDFSRLPNSIVAVGGNLTGRSIGGPITAFALENIRQGAESDFVNYQSTLDNGRILRSSTIFIRDGEGNATACLCINLDVSDWLRMRDAIDAFASPSTTPATAHDDAPGAGSEIFALTVEDVTVQAVRQAIASVGVPIELMQKRHKIEVVRRLEERGLFLIRDAVNFVANELATSRYTIYNYLNELKDAGSGSSAEGRRATGRVLPGMDRTPPGAS